MQVPRNVNLAVSLLFIVGLVIFYNWLWSRSQKTSYPAVAMMPTHWKNLINAQPKTHHATTKNKTIKNLPKKQPHAKPPQKKKPKTLTIPKTHHAITKNKTIKNLPTKKAHAKLQQKSKPKGPTMPLLDVIKAKNQPTPGRSIIFHETSNFQRTERYGLIQLTPREACAIESAALHNPSLTVFVLFAGATHRTSSGDPLVKALHHYKNIRLRHLNVGRYVAGTPIEKWLSSGKIYKSKYLFPHISDLLRYVTMYRYGGLYMDLDVVVLKNLAKMPPNFMGAETKTSLASSVMRMSHTDLGRRVATSCLRDLQDNYNPSSWGFNGPGVITRVAKKLCNTTSVQSMIQKPKRCQGFTVFDPKVFSALPWQEWKAFFDPKKLKHTMKKISKSSVVHVWNKFSKAWKLMTNATSAYTKLAKKNCPKSFAAAGKFF